MTQDIFTPPKPDDTPEDIAEAEKLLEKINTKVLALLEPLAREMRIMGWPPHHAEVMWKTVALDALERAKKVGNG